MAKLKRELLRAEQEYRRAKSDRKAHPEAVQRAWERYTEAARKLPGARVRM